MPNLKVVQNTGQTRDQLGRFTKKLGDFRDRYLELLASQAILRSPVDTGTYITSFEINTTGVPSGYTTSKGKPTKQEWQPYADEGFNTLLGDISSLPDSTTQVSLTNKAEHAQDVEDNHGVFAEVRRESGRIAQEVFSGL